MKALRVLRDLRWSRRSCCTSPCRPPGTRRPPRSCWRWRAGPRVWPPPSRGPGRTDHSGTIACREDVKRENFKLDWLFVKARGFVDVSQLLRRDLVRSSSESGGERDGEEEEERCCHVGSQEASDRPGTCDTVRYNPSPSELCRVWVRDCDTRITWEIVTIFKPVKEMTLS